MTKATETVVETVVETIAELIAPKAANPDPNPNAGIEHLRAEYPGALKVWEVRGPKGAAPSDIFAAFLPDAEPPRVVLVHQYHSGKFTIWDRA